MGAIRAWGKEGGEFYAAWDKEDTAKAIEQETLRADEAQAERQKAVLARKARANQAREVDLDDTKAKLVDHLSALPSGGSKEHYLKGQHRGHMVRAAARSHKFPFKTKMGADAKGVGASVAHLTAVVVLMIDAAPEVPDLAEEEAAWGSGESCPRRRWICGRDWWTKPLRRTLPRPPRWRCETTRNWWSSGAHMQTKNHSGVVGGNGQRRQEKDEGAGKL